MKRKKRMLPFITAILLCLSTITVGLSAWIVSSVSTVETIDVNDNAFNAVCVNQNTGVGYKTIHEGIAAAKEGEMVYVKPNLGKEIQISTNLTIPNKVTFCLPYEINSGKPVYDNANDVDSDESVWLNNTNTQGIKSANYGFFSDYLEEPTTNVIYNLHNSHNADSVINVYSIQKARQTLVRVMEDVLITVKGNLIIGGESGYKAQYNVCGGVNGMYSELLLEKGARIVAENGSNIKCFGYIKQVSNDDISEAGNENIITLNGGSNLYAHLTIYDFKGGTNTLSLYSSYCPFYLFDVTNIQTKIRINHNARFYSIVRVQLNNNGFNKFCNFIGPRSAAEEFMFQIGDNGYLFYEYVPTVRKTTDFKGITYVDLFGDVYVNKLVVPVKYYVSITIDTSNYFLPISFKYHITVKSESLLSIPYNVKFLPGAKFEIEDGGKVVVGKDSNIIFYDKSYKYTVNCFREGLTSTGEATANQTLVDAVCINNGEIMGSGSLGGLIQTSKAGAILDLNNITLEVSSKETKVTSGLGNGGGTDVTNTKKATGYLSNGATSASDLTNNFYESKGSYWDLAEIYVYLDDSTTSISLTKDGNKGTLSVNSNASPELSYSWSYKEGSTQKTNSGSSVTITNSSTSNTLKITAISVTITQTGDHGTQTKIFTTAETLELDKKSNTCFSADTLVKTNNGDKLIDDITEKDLVLSFNHFNGEYEYKPIGALFNHGEGLYEIIDVMFNDGTNIEFIGVHGLFDVTLNTYVDIDASNYKSYIGHEVVKFSDTGIDTVRIQNIELKEKYTTSYSMTSAENLNVVTNDILTISPFLTGLLTMFEFDENLMYDSHEVESAIDMYGFTPYEEYAMYTSEKFFINGRIKYANIAIVKGTITKKHIIGVLELCNYCITNGELIIY